MREKNYLKKSSENGDKYLADFDRLVENDGYEYLSKYLQGVLVSKNWDLHSDFDDAFHDSLIKARRKVPVKFGKSLKHAESIEQVPKLKNYLTDFFLKEVRNYFRVSERRYKRTKLMPINFLETMVFKDPKGEQLRQERLEEMYEQIAKMRPVLKEPLSLHLEGRSDEEISQSLKLKPQTVYNVLSMAKKAVMDALKYAFGSKT